MKIINIEDFINKLKCNVYPVTFIKFILNKKRILSYFDKASNNENKIYGIQYSLNRSKCKKCIEKKNLNIPCRQHSSIERVLRSENVAFDLDTGLYFFKNEIFKKIENGRIVIVFCPHTKLIVGQITKDKVNKIIPITVDIPKLFIPSYKDKKDFSSKQLFDLNLKCWFNTELSIVTLQKNSSDLDFCLIPNYWKEDVIFKISFLIKFINYY